MFWWLYCVCVQLYVTLTSCAMNMMTFRAIAPSLVESSPKSRKKPENSPCWRPPSVSSLGHWGRVVSKLELTRCATPWAVFSPRNFPAMLSPSRNLVTTAAKFTHEYRSVLVQVSAWTGLCLYRSLLGQVCACTSLCLYRSVLVQVSACTGHCFYRSLLDLVDHVERDFTRDADGCLSIQVVPCPLKSP